MNYENRIVCFIDILAFKQIVNSTLDKEGEDKPKEIKAINDLLELTREVLSMDRDTAVSKSKIITQFSDSIVISFRVEEESEIFFTLVDILDLIMNFVFRGVLVRGGIAFGKLIHNDKILFGPGMITAYETESKAAMYPRVILDQTVIEIAKMFHSDTHSPEFEEEAIMGVVTKDTDEMFYIDYIKKGQQELNDPEYDFPQYLEKLKNIIEGNKAIENPDIKVKTGWLINKFNELVNDATNPEFIKQLVDNGNIELAEYYQALEKI